MEMSLTGLNVMSGIAPGDLNLTCSVFSWREGRPSCTRGTLRLPESWVALDTPLPVVLEPLAEEGYRLIVS
ncbi:MAG: hypothetical protein V2J20_11805, partial [Wenzhouxiangella sp.]|nr:hypothetical protein [Wenzhouxiangella sp.]